MTTVNTDAKFNGLGGFGYTGAQEDRELKFYQANGATSNNLPDAELQFLTLQGYPTGTSEDRWFAYLTSLGYKGSVDDMIKPWWSVGPGVGYLFTGGAPGVWYDPSDYSTLFQDSAGTTPVTAVEQPVGLMLDKSQGLVLGSELAPSTIPSVSGAGWTTNGTSITATNSTASGTIALTASTSSTKFYQVTFTASGLSGATSYMVFSSGVAAVTKRINTAKSYSFIVPGQGTAAFEIAPYEGTAFSVTISAITVKELAGNHAFQATSASRPVLSARYNLLTKTEQFDDAAWTKTNSTITVNATTAPDGTATADLMVETVDTGIHRLSRSLGTLSAQSLTVSIRHKAGIGTRNLDVALATSTNYVDTIFSSTTGVVVAETDVPGAVFSGKRNTFSGPDAQGFYTATITVNLLSTQTISVIYGLANNASNSYTGGGTSGIYIWGAQLVVTNSLTSNAYQRVNTATDYATTGFLPYLKFDGVDDSLSTNSISFTSTDKMSVFAGVRKLSDAATGMIYETSQIYSSFSGAVSLYTTSSNYKTSSGGSVFAEATSSSLPSPLTNVLTELASISGDQLILRVNGVQNAQSTADQGTGNYGNYPLFIGRRNNTNFPFNGQIYSMVIVGKAVTAGELTNTENFVNRKTGAY